MYPDLSNNFLKPDQSDQAILDDILDFNVSTDREKSVSVSKMVHEQDSSAKQARILQNRNQQMNQYKYRILSLESYVNQLKL